MKRGILLFLCFGSSLLLSEAVTVTKDQSIKSEKPWFCHDLQCPDYVIQQTFDVEQEQIELRQYQAAHWVSTNVTGVDYNEAVTVGFYRLFGYISGSNVPEKKIEMTAPVITLVTPGPGPSCESHFTVSFFIPQEFQGDPPKPLRDDVFIQMLPEHAFYVYSYGGFSSEGKMLKKASHMIGLLDRLQQQYNADTFYSASYDPPFRLINRHNEIWIPTKV